MISRELVLLSAIVALDAGATQAELDVFIDRLLSDKTMLELAFEQGCSRSNIGQQLVSVRRKIERRFPVAA